MTTPIPQAGNWTELTPTSPSWTAELDRELVEFIAVEAIWFIHCCTGLWTMNQGFRILCLVEGAVRALIVNVWRRETSYTTSWFVAFLLGRIKVDKSKRGATRAVILIIWIALDLASLWSRVLYWVNLGYEGLVVIGLLSYMYSQVSRLRSSRASTWALKLMRLCIWGFGWGVLSILCLLGYTTNLTLIVWFVLYGSLFPQPTPREAESESPGQERQRPASDRRWTRGVEHIYEEVQF